MGCEAQGALLIGEVAFHMTVSAAQLNYRIPTRDAYTCARPHPITSFRANGPGVSFSAEEFEVC